MDAVFQTVNEIKNRPGYFDKNNTLQILFDLFQGELECRSAYSNHARELRSDCQSSTILISITAGSQTSVITLHWALLKLASDQELQQKLYEEIVAYVTGQFFSLLNQIRIGLFF